MVMTKAERDELFLVGAAHLNELFGYLLDGKEDCADKLSKIDGVIKKERGGEKT